MIVWVRAQFLNFCACAHESEKSLRFQPDERALRALLKWAALTKALAINNIFYCENVTFSGFLNYVLTLLSQIALTFLLDIDKCSFKVKGKGKPFFE